MSIDVAAIDSSSNFLFLLFIDSDGKSVDMLIDAAMDEVRPKSKMCVVRVLEWIGLISIG